MRLFVLFLALLPALTTLTAPPARAQVAIGKFIESWQTIRRSLRDTGENSCQAIQCETEYCASNRAFVLFATSSNDYIVPSFNHGVMVAKGTKVRLQVGGKSYALVNTSKGPDKFLAPTNRRDLDGILRDLRRVEAAGGARKFQVIDSKGRKVVFSARGTLGVFKEFKRACGTTIPR